MGGIVENIGSGLQAAGDWTFGENSLLGQAGRAVGGGLNYAAGGVGRAIERGVSQAAPALAKGDLASAIAQGASGLITGGMSGASEQAGLNQLEESVIAALNAAKAEMDTADADRQVQLNQFISDAESRLNMIRARQEDLANQIKGAQLAGIAAERGGLRDILKLQQEGIAAREALTADEEAAARRITAPGGLLERQKQSNALAQARALQKARMGGPAARAAIMGQYATQGAELGMQAQRDIMAAQDRARQARAGLLGERAAAAVAEQQGVMGLRGRQTAANIAQFQGEADAQLGFQRGIGDLYRQRYDYGDQMRLERGRRNAAYQQDLGQARIERIGRGMGLNREETQRNSAYAQAAMADQSAGAGGGLNPMLLKGASALLGAPIG